MTGILCNDIHSKLNPTRVAQVLRPTSEAEVVAALKEAASDGRAVSICGARHAMGALIQALALVGFYRAGCGLGGGRRRLLDCGVHSQLSE